MTSFSSLECEYCNKIFSSQSNLNNHKKHAKYCLKIQGKDAKNYTCNFCEKDFTSNRNLQEHNCKKEILKYKEKIELKNDESEDGIEEKIKEYEILLKEKQDDIQEKDNKIREYEILLRERDKQYEIQIKELKAMLEKANETIAEIAKQPTITSNATTTTNNNQENYLMLNFDIDDLDNIKEMLETYLTPKVLQSGQEGVAEVLQDKLLTRDGTPLYECTDVSRKSFEFRNRDGDIEIDPHANRLIRNLQRSNISQIASEKGKEIWTKDDGSIDYDRQHAFMPRVVEVITIKNDPTKLRNQLAHLLARQKRLKK